MMYCIPEEQFVRLWMHYWLLEDRQKLNCVYLLIVVSAVKYPSRLIMRADPLIPLLPKRLRFFGKKEMVRKKWFCFNRVSIKLILASGFENITLLFNATQYQTSSWH